MTVTTAARTKTAEGTRFRCIGCAPFVKILRGSDTGRGIQGIAKCQKARRDWLKAWLPVRARPELTDRRNQSIGPIPENRSVIVRRPAPWDLWSGSGIRDPIS